jgi:hypothetical protein
MGKIFLQFLLISKKRFEEGPAGNPFGPVPLGEAL